MRGYKFSTDYKKLYALVNQKPDNIIIATLDHRKDRVLCLVHYLNEEIYFATKGFLYLNVDAVAGEKNFVQSCYSKNVQYLPPEGI